MQHNFFIRIFLLIACILPLSNQVNATTVDTDWKNNLELGVVQTSGNTHILSVNLKGSSIYNTDNWRTSINGDMLNTSADNATTSEKYHASFQEDWKVSSRDYLFLRLSFESVRFAGFKRRTLETVGYGRQLIKTENLEWKAEIGSGSRQSKLITNISTTEFIGRAATDAAWKFSESSKLTEYIDTEGGIKGWTSTSVTSLQTALNSYLSSKISLDLTHNSNVPANTKKLDIETSITMVVNF